MKYNHPDIPDNEFVDIPIAKGYYQINKLGQVRRISSGKILSPYFRKGVGYYYISMCLGSLDSRIHESIHRLLCITFIPNPENKPCVNHINAIRHDNTLSNLEWATYSENNKHAFVMGNQPSHEGGGNAFAKLIIDTHTGIFFDTIKEVAEAFNINYGTLRGDISGKRSHRGHRFTYA